MLSLGDINVFANSTKEETLQQQFLFLIQDASDIKFEANLATKAHIVGESLLGKRSCVLEIREIRFKKSERGLYLLLTL